jgi:hypothetical protein
LELEEEREDVSRYIGGEIAAHPSKIRRQNRFWTLEFYFYGHQRVEKFGENMKMQNITIGSSSV